MLSKTIIFAVLGLILLATTCAAIANSQLMLGQAVAVCAAAGVFGVIGGGVAWIVHEARTQQDRLQP